MVFDLSQIADFGPYESKSEPSRQLFTKDGKVFLVVNKNTIEVRCDTRLSENLKEKYESVMESRYFGRGGIEIVLSGQLSQQELVDLVRLSYIISSSPSS